MLLNITIENFRSYNQAQTLSLIASENNGVNSAKIGNLEVRKSAVIYGANASGKSNIIKALLCLVDIIAGGIPAPDQFYARPILVQKLYKTFFDQPEPTFISIDFSVGETIYNYSLRYDSQFIHYEALFDTSNDDVDVMIFERVLIDKDSRLYEYTFEPTSYTYIFSDEQMPYANDTIGRLKVNTPVNLTLLNKLVAENCQKIKAITDYFQFGLVIRTNPYGVIGRPLFAEADLNSAANHARRDVSYAKKTLEALNSIGVNVEKLDIEYNDNNPLEGERLNQVRNITSYYNLNGNTHQLSFLADESDGTQKFYGYLNLIDYIMQVNGVLVVDELETHFHPLLVEEIIRAVHNSNSRAQLIFTTHNPTLLTESIFERDQIYFADKNDKLATELYSLVDFNDLQPNSNLMAKYLAGRFGAVPHINSFIFTGDK
jgi:AAA15 family ATPase/GTPase